jgi:hypothetical protein
MPFDGTELGTFENHPLAKLGAVVFPRLGIARKLASGSRGLRSPLTMPAFFRQRRGQTVVDGVEPGISDASLQLEDRDDYVR